MIMMIMIMMIMIMMIMLWSSRLAFGVVVYGSRRSTASSTRRGLVVGRAWAAAYAASGGVVPRRAVLL